MNGERQTFFHGVFGKKLPKLLVAVFIIHHLSFILLNAQQLPFRSYSTRDGLLSNVCYFFFQDKQGYLWTSTEAGLSRFDGRQFVNYEKAASGKSIGLSISFAQTADGRIWAGGNGNGLFVYDGKTWQHFDVSALPRSNYVTALLETEPNVLLIGTEEGLYEWRSGKIRAVVPDAKMMRTYKFWAAGSLYRDMDGKFWALFDGELRQLDPKDGSLSQAFPHPAPDDFFDWANLLPDGRWVVGCVNQRRTYVFKDKKLQTTLSLPNCVTGYAFGDEEGSLWISTNRGFLKTNFEDPSVADGQWIAAENGLPSNLISSVFVDREHNLWFASYGKGIYKLEETESYRFSYPFAAGLGCADEKGRLWFSTPDGLRVIGRTAGGGWSEQHLEPFPDEYFKSMGTVKILPGNQLWLGCDDGALVNYIIEERPVGSFRLRYRRQIGITNGFPKAMSIWIFIDSKGRLWYAENGVPRLHVVDISAEKPRLVKSLSFDPGVRLSNGREVTEDADGNFWFAYENNNVLVFDADLNLLKTVENLPGNNEVDVNCTHHDRDGAVWFGTQALGLLRQTPDGKIQRIGKAEGLLSNHISHIVEDANHTLWVATWHGLAFVHYNGDSLLLDGNREVAQCPIWSLGVFPDGTGWVATNFDVVFHKKRAARQPFPPPISLYKLTVNGKEHPLENGLRLAAGENNLVFDFGTICLQSRNDIRFRYKLERNGSGDWNTPTDLLSVNFAGLKAGSYSFWVEALGADNLKSPAPARFDFTIVPPVWQRWWFITACLLVIGGLIWFLVNLRIRRLVEIERLRARIAADLHDDIGSGLTRIALTTEMLMRQKKEEQAPLFQRIGDTARELVEAMSDIVWAIDPQNDSLGRVADRIQFFANDVCEAQGIECHFEFDPAAKALKPGSGIVSTIVLIAKEAVNNASRHAACQHLFITIHTSPQELRLVVRDDGRGFEEKSLSRINGLTNMRRRAEKMGGNLNLTTSPGAGTAVAVVLPLS